MGTGPNGLCMSVCIPESLIWVLPFLIPSILSAFIILVSIPLSENRHARVKELLPYVALRVPIKDLIRLMMEIKTKGKKKDKGSN